MLLGFSLSGNIFFSVLCRREESGTRELPILPNGGTFEYNLFLSLPTFVFCLCLTTGSQTPVLFANNVSQCGQDYISSRTNVQFP